MIKLGPATSITMASTDSNDAIISPRVLLQLEKYHDRLIGQRQIVRYRAPDVQKLHTLGAGSFCSVSLVSSKPQKKVFAMKHLDMKKISTSNDFVMSATDLIMESYLLSQLDHKNIIKLHGVSGVPFSQSFEDDEFGYFLLMDVMDETLQDQLRKWRNDPLCFEEKNRFSKLARKSKKLNIRRMYLRIETVALSIAQAMKYIHKCGILHCDLKPANVGFNKDTGAVCIFDFGLARKLTSCRSDDICGTPRYLAPEVLRGEGYSVMSDVYSFGILLHEVASLQQQKRRNELSIKSQDDIWNACRTLARPSLDCIPCPNVAQLIQDCWANDHKVRPTFEVICLTLQSILHTNVSDDCKKDHTESESTLDTVLDPNTDDKF